MTRSDQDMSGDAAALRLGGPRRRWGRATAVALLLAAAVLAVWAAAGLRSRTVVLVNGLGVEYGVLVDDRPIMLEPRSRYPIDLEPGSHRIRPVVLSGSMASVTLDVPRAGLRGGAEPMAVVNLDRTALLRFDDDGAAPRWRTGKAMYRLAPDEQVDLIAPADDQRLVSFAAASLPGDELITLLARRAWHEPNNEVLLAVLARQLSAEAFERVMRPILEVKPIAIEAHRAYQIRLDRQNATGALRNQYETLLAHNPQDPVRQYLMGRIEPDPQTANQLLRSAAEADAGGHAAAALAWAALAGGDVDAARRWADTAVQRDPERLRFALLQQEVWQAAGQWAKVAEQRQRWLAEGPGDYDLTLDLVGALAAAGRADAARQTLDELLQLHAAGDATPDLITRVRSKGEATIAIARGDRAAAAEALRPLLAGDEPPLWPNRYAAALAAGQLDAAADALAAGDRVGNWADPLLLAIEARRKGDGAVLRQQVAAAAGAAEQAGREGRTLARWLTGEIRPTAADLRTIQLDPADKPIALVYFAGARPALAPSALELARTLNYQLDVGRLVVHDAIEALGADQPD